MKGEQEITAQIRKMGKVALRPLDLIAGGDLREKIVGLLLGGVPAGMPRSLAEQLGGLRENLLQTNVADARVVVFGGGTGLSNLVGGDSRSEVWQEQPFKGLKEIFPKTRSVVCVTDNGGSTGELLKDLPLVALGDLRHVLLSSIQKALLQERYGVSTNGASHIARTLFALFNHRGEHGLLPDDPLVARSLGEQGGLPRELRDYLARLHASLHADPRLTKSCLRSNCLGNLLLAANVYRHLDPSLNNRQLAMEPKMLHSAMLAALPELAKWLGAYPEAVLPCTSVSAQLRIRYANGVEVVGESKLEESRRGVPVESVEVDYTSQPVAYEEIVRCVEKADVLILAPGSLYSSIIPVFKVPGIAEAVRANSRAVKILISNLWVQAGETDLSFADPDRKFHVSDMVRAYERNIPGGITGLFQQVLCISLDDVPGSVLQKYAVEGKIPIYLDREAINRQHYLPIECGVYSREALTRRGVIQHDPNTLALAIKGLYVARRSFSTPAPLLTVAESHHLGSQPFSRVMVPCQRYEKLEKRVGQLQLKVAVETSGLSQEDLRQRLVDVYWNHPVIPLEHLDYFAGVECVAPSNWGRDQQWDNVFSFFDPDDKLIKIRADQVGERQSLETALMIATGEALLGNYAAGKQMAEVIDDGIILGRVYHLRLRPLAERLCYFTYEELRQFLELSRMCPGRSEFHYTRLLNRGEGFTPPGLLMGLMYAWYVDNRLATHIEYKMSVMKIRSTDLIPEQMKMASRRQRMIEFFRHVVFRRD